MSKFKRGDRVVLKDDSGISIFYQNYLRNHILKEVEVGSSGVVTYAHDNHIQVKFDGDCDGSMDLLGSRFVLEEAELKAQKFKKVFYPCSHDYQELEDLIQLGK